MSEYIHSTIHIYIYSVHNNLKGGFIPEKFKRSMEAFDVLLLKSANNLRKDYLRSIKHIDMGLY